MELLPPAIFASIVASNKDLLKELSQQFIKKYCGEKSLKDFNQACNKLDFDLANNILDDLVKELTGTRSVNLALSEYANKFSDSIPNLDND